MKIKNYNELKKLKEELQYYTRKQKSDLVYILYTKNKFTYRKLASIFSCDVKDIIKYFEYIDVKICVNPDCENYIKIRSEDFHKHSHTDGYNSRCKKCEHKRRQAHYLKNEKNNVEVQKSNRKWKNDNKDEINRKRRERRQTDPEVRIKSAAYEKNRCDTDPIWRLRRRFSNLISYHLVNCATPKLRKRKRHWEDIVGYTLNELKEHLEKQFHPGMTWDNYGQWHADHIKPSSSFQIIGLECDEFKSCWSLNNLQPLWAKDNIEKSNNLNWKKSLDNDIV